MHQKQYLMGILFCQGMKMTTLQVSYLTLCSKYVPPILNNIKVLTSIGRETTLIDKYSGDHVGNKNRTIGQFDLITPYI